MSLTILVIATLLAGAPPPDAAPAPPPPAADDDIIVVEARPRSPADPFVAANAQSFAVTQQVDKAFVGPVSIAYKTKIPEPIRNGIRNFLNNTREPVIFLNFLLQFKPGKAAETFGRFAINTTVGAAGLFDMAKRRPFKLPRRPNGFADTMGYYGVKPGPFLFLPLIGPTTVRDAIGGGLDRLVLPFAFGAPFTDFAYGASTGTLSGLEYRSSFDDQLRTIREESRDPYRTRRELYLRKRQAEIDDLRGRPSEPAPPVIAEAKLPG
ncbi:VacJ family lipoprotein [Sphingomonas sp. MMS24-J13]|uniref:MlaA family lipoprotein n=1 Tax=Sphingomonas sp. MMS24-J13 TaxID=3238686 RepID=UPI00384BB2BA